MTGTAFSSPSSYWQVSRAPRYSLLFALPLLVFYQVLAVLLAHGARSVRNGADVILQALLPPLAAGGGRPPSLACLFGAGFCLVRAALPPPARRPRVAWLARWRG